MVNPTITCGICGEPINHSDRQPVALPGCGHTFCRLCLIHINNVYEEIKCPTCRHLHTGTPPEDLPANYALLSIIEPDTEANNVKTSKEAPPSSSSYKISKNCSNADSRASNNSSSGNVHPSGNSRRGKALKVLKWVGIGAAAAVGGAALVAAAPVALTGVGFTAAGIAKGSFAASMMSSAAVANGGGVAAGSLVAVLQSAGAAGIGTTASAALGATGAGAGGGIAYGISKLFKRSRRGNGSDECESSGNDGHDGNDDRCRGDFPEGNRKEERVSRRESERSHDKDVKEKADDTDKDNSDDDDFP